MMTSRKQQRTRDRASKTRATTKAIRESLGDAFPGVEFRTLYVGCCWRAEWSGGPELQDVRAFLETKTEHVELWRDGHYGGIANLRRKDGRAIERPRTGVQRVVGRPAVVDREGHPRGEARRDRTDAAVVAVSGRPVGAKVARLTARQLFLELSREPSWARETTRVRWCAARYYAGVERLEDLESHARPRPVAKDACLPSLLTGEQVRMIRDAR